MKLYSRKELIFSGKDYILVLFSFKVLGYFGDLVEAAEQPNSTAGIRMQVF